MIQKPVEGMRVVVDYPEHCCGGDDNHAGTGVITHVEEEDSFLVKMDDYPEEEWYRCRECVSEISKENTK